MIFKKYEYMVDYVMKNIVSNTFYTPCDVTGHVKATCIIPAYYCFGKYNDAEKVEIIGTDLEEAIGILKEDVMYLIYRGYLIDSLINKNGDEYYELANIVLL